MTNEEYVNLFYARKDLEKKVDSLYKKKAKLQDKLDDAIFKLVHSEEVDAIWDNHAISKIGDTFFRSVSTGRIAEIYLNAHNNTTWGIHINDSSHGWYGGKFLGADFSYPKVMAMAKRWVVEGEY